MKKLTFDEFKSAKSYREVFETEPCSRCGGSGRYSFNLMDGDLCYGCNGTGFKWTTKGGKAWKKFDAMRETEVCNIKVGDKVGVHLGLGPKVSFVTVVSVGIAAWKYTTDGVAQNCITLHTERIDHVAPENSKIRKAWTKEELYGFYLEAIK